MDRNEKAGSCQVLVTGGRGHRNPQALRGHRDRGHPPDRQTRLMCPDAFQMYTWSPALNARYLLKGKG